MTNTQLLQACFRRETRQDFLVSRMNQASYSPSQKHKIKQDINKSKINCGPLIENGKRMASMLAKSTQKTTRRFYLSVTCGYLVHLKHRHAVQQPPRLGMGTQIVDWICYDSSSKFPRKWSTVSGNLSIKICNDIPLSASLQLVNIPARRKQDSGFPIYRAWRWGKTVAVARTLTSDFFSPFFMSFWTIPLRMIFRDCWENGLERKSRKLYIFLARKPCFFSTSFSPIQPLEIRIHKNYWTVKKSYLTLVGFYDGSNSFHHIKGFDHSPTLLLHEICYHSGGWTTDSIPTMNQDLQIKFDMSKPWSVVEGELYGIIF